jgi:hypothetical protein
MKHDTHLAAGCLPLVLITGTIGRVAKAVSLIRERLSMSRHAFVPQDMLLFRRTGFYAQLRD